MANLTDNQFHSAIIGCGNPNRRDDGAGPHVINILNSYELPKHIGVFDAGTDGMAVLYRARGIKQLIIVDARIPEGNAGAIFEVPGEVLSAPPPQSLNLHDFRWDHALFAGRKIYKEDFPQDVHVFLIEADSLDLGIGLSDPVAKSAKIVADKICRLVTENRKMSQ